MKTFFYSFFLFCFINLYAQNDSTHFIKVHFLYGSKPLKKYKHTEHKYFGGLHGGHVSVEVDNIDYGFVPSGKFRVFAHKKSHHSIFIKKEINNQPAYLEGTKIATFIIPITVDQYERINQIHSEYCSTTPYDYAFLGMRCAAATQDILGQISIVKERKRIWNICSTFYPKKLRTRMFKLAREKKYQIIYQEGRKTRKWEKD